MSKQVDKWLEKGRKHCKKGNHWYILCYPDYLICPVCGAKSETDGRLPEYNGFLVDAVSIQPSFCEGQALEFRKVI